MQITPAIKHAYQYTVAHSRERAAGSAGGDNHRSSPAAPKRTLLDSLARLRLSTTLTTARVCKTRDCSRTSQPPSRKRPLTRYCAKQQATLPRDWPTE